MATRTLVGDLETIGPTETLVVSPMKGGRPVATRALAPVSFRIF